MSNTPRILIWGASGHASVVADIVRLEGKFEIAGLIDDMNPLPHEVAFGKVIGGRDALPRMLKDGVRHILIGIGDNAVRLRLAAIAVELGYNLAMAVHPRATLAAGAGIRAGTVVMAGAVINPGTCVGQNAIVNTGATVDHDCTLGDGVHICPGTHLAGNVAVGEGTFIGVGSAVRDRIRIGAHCVLGAGSVVVEDIPDHALVYGCPARVVRLLRDAPA